MTVIYFASNVTKQALKIKGNVVIYQADKKSSLVSVVNKSQYRDTHSEYTIGNVRDTDYLVFFSFLSFFFFLLILAVSRKQHTINTTCM